MKRSLHFATKYRRSVAPKIVSTTAFVMMVFATLVFPTSRISAQAPVMQVSATPVTLIDATAPDGSVRFATASWATRLSDGKIVIADQTDGALRIADSSGRITRSWGRLGDAPGEFRAISWVSKCGGDTLYVWDARATRLSVMHATSGYVRQISAPTSSGTFSAVCDRNGNVAMFSGVAPRRGGASSTTALKTADGRPYELGVVGTSISVRGRTGAMVQELRELPYGEMLMGPLGPNGGMGAMPRPLGGLTSFALIDGQLVVARTDSSVVTWYRRDGSVERTSTLPAVRGAPSVAQYEAAINRAVEIAPARVRPDLVAFAKQVPRPASHRAFSQMFAGADGLLWFVTSLPGDKVTSMRALNRAGTVAATLEINAAVEVFEVGTDYVLGRTETPDGEQRVVLYRVSRR